MSVHLAEPAPAGRPDDADGSGCQGAGVTTTARVLQRVVMPIDRDSDVRVLYVEGRTTWAADMATAEESARRQVTGTARTGTTGAVDGIIAGRRRIVVPARRRVSFSGYFNAFPAGYWRRWTTVDKISLNLRVRGECLVIVYRSTSRGHTQRIASLSTERGPAHDLRVDLSLEPFVDGGWYWFDLVAGDEHAVVESADWRTETADARTGTVSVGITVRRHPVFCVQQLRRLADVADTIDEILIVDQSGGEVAARPDLAEAAGLLAEKVRVLEQNDLGRSGGSARVMTETLRAGRSDHVLLLGEDVEIEPEGALRASTFADLCHTPTLVGGQVFSPFLRSVLCSFGDGVDRYLWRTGVALHTHPWHDFARHGLRQTGWMHRRIEVDHTDWRMCLIPMNAVRALGAAMPFFSGWDDIEYGLRARAAGFATVTLPGAAAWHHMAEEAEAEDDLTACTDYLQARNRLVTALLHSPYSRGGNLIRDGFSAVNRHTMAMEYSTAELILAAVKDVLGGPAHLHTDAPDRLRRLRELRAGYADAQVLDAIDGFPPVRRPPFPRGRLPMPPHGSLARFRRAITDLLRQLRPVGVAAQSNPQLVVPRMDHGWRLLSQLDSVLVSTDDGTGVAWYRRDPRRFRSLMLRNIALHARLLLRWPALAASYRDSTLGPVASERRSPR